jgi:hypothetical protein
MPDIDQFAIIGPSAGKQTNINKITEGYIPSTALAWRSADHYIHDAERHSPRLSPIFFLII